MDKSEPRIVFYGDSRIGEWPQPKIGGFEFINRGFAGQTSSQVLLRYDNHVKPLGADIILVQVGINDLMTIPFFPERKAEIITGLKRNLLEIIKMAQEQGTAVFLTTIFPIGEEPLAPELFWFDEVNLAVSEVNQFISSLSLKLINLQSKVESSENINSGVCDKLFELNTILFSST